MTSKSRLGKGLGALFPTLPGEEPTAEVEIAAPVGQETASAAQEAASATKQIKQTKASKTKDTKTAKPAAKKKASGKRTAMPTIGDISHPSDLFFGESKTTEQAVSRETSAESDELQPVAGGYLAELKLADIGPNAHQPRTVFFEDELRELSESIQEVGVLQPIVVRRRPAEQIAQAKEAKQNKSEETTSSNQFADRMDSEYELIMGERRWRASQMAGLETIPAIVKTTSDDDMLRDALLENLHRVALNPLEEAAAYQQMIDEFGLTQAELSKSVSKSRPQIANMLRLLNLPASVQKKVASGVLSAGHARALLGLTDTNDMDRLAARIVSEGLSVRSTEEIVAMKTMSEEQPKRTRTSASNPWAGSAIQQSLENHFDTKVSIKGTAKHGRIEIVFSSPDDMNRILQMLVPDADSNGWV